MVKDITRQWYLDCLGELRQHFKKLSYDDSAFRWILIERFPLPSTFHETDSSVLIRTPGNHLENYSAYRFYVDMDLSRFDNDQKKHLIDGGYNDLRDRGYTRLCYHLSVFRPRYPAKKGDTLMDICQSLYHFLGQAWE